jgi:hypothetical protein
VALSTHTCLWHLSVQLTGVLCQLPFAEFVEKIRIRCKRPFGEFYRLRKQDCNRLAAFTNATVRDRPRAVFRRCDFNASKLSFSPAVETSTRRLRAGSLANPSRWCRSCLCRSCEPLADWLPPCCPPARLSRALREVSARGTIDLK